MSRPSLFVLPEHVRDQDYALATIRTYAKIGRA